MNGSIRILFLLAGLILLAILAWFIPTGKSSSVNRQAQEKLVILSPHWDGIRNEFGSAFSSWYQKKYNRTIAVEWLDLGGTSDCVRYAYSEFKRSPKGIGIDLFFGGGTDPYLSLKKDGLLDPLYLDTSIINRIPQNFSGIDIFDKDSCWFGAVLSGFGIVHNKWVEKKMGFAPPKAWEDLADPAYFSWVGLADPRNSGTMHLMFEIIVQAYGWNKGWEILTGIAANTKTFSKGANEVPKMVAKGDMAYGLAIDMYGWAAVSEAGEDKVGFILPANLTIISADGIARFKGAPNPIASQRFIEFVLSEDGQKIWFLKKGTSGGPVKQEMNRMSIRPDFYDRFKDRTAIRQNPFASVNTLNFDNKLASQRWLVLNDLIGVALIDQNKELRNAWKKATKASLGDSAWAAMPVTEHECSDLVKGTWKDAVKKNRELLRWNDFFRNKYNRLSR
jgi:ABC-type Fe3+ transport system substrate-binding protein